MTWTTLLYTGLFSPRLIFAHLRLQTVSLRLEFAQKQLSLKRDNKKHLNLPSLKFAS